MAVETPILKRGRSRKEAAQRIREHGLPCSDAYLAQMATDGTGPLYRRVCGRAIYLDADIDAWAQSRIGPLIRRASDAAEAA
jgi:TorA maturation chaperone TorD